MNTINSSTTPTSKMSIDEIVRWNCLIEAIKVADGQMRNLGIDPEKYDWVKPVAIEKYIGERFHSMKHDIVYEIKNGAQDDVIDNDFFK